MNYDRKDLINWLENYYMLFEKISYDIYSGNNNLDSTIMSDFECQERMLNRESIEYIIQNTDNIQQEDEIIIKSFISIWLDRQVSKYLSRNIYIENKSKIKLGMSNIYFNDIDAFLSNESSRINREKIELFRQKILYKMWKNDYKILNKVNSKVQSWGYKNYLNFCIGDNNTDKLKNMSNRILEETLTVYMEYLQRFSYDLIGLGKLSIKKYDIPALLRGKEYDKHFLKNLLITSVERTVKNIGFCLENLNLDFEERDGKLSRAYCSKIKIPNQVIMVIYPVGGYKDYCDCFHELGHLLTYVNIDSNASFMLKRMRNRALDECFAMLFENLIRNAVWYEINFKIKMDVKLQRFLNFTDLLSLRRNAGMILYELSLYEKELPSPECCKKMYCDYMSKALSVDVYEDSFIHYVDKEFCSKDYVLGWILEVYLRDYMEKTYGYQWFANKNAGVFLKNVWNQYKYCDIGQFCNLIGINDLNENLLIENILNNLPCETMT